MEANVEQCVCESGTLAVLNDVQRAYEERLELISRAPASDKLQKQVQLLKSWVSDLVAQNSLLARTVEDLEIELTTRVLNERRKITDKGKTKKKSDEANEKGNNENSNKERDCRLSNGVKQYEQNNLGLKNDVSLSKYHTPDVSKRDVSITADICCASTRECGDVEPVKEYGSRLLREDSHYQECIHQMERSGEHVRELRAANVSLTEQVRGLQGLCAALEEQCRVTARQEHLKDYIIREMRRQLIQAKTKLKDISSTRISQSEDRGSRSPRAPSYESLCVRQQPRRKNRDSALDISSCNCVLHDGSGDDGSIKDQQL